MSLLLMTLSSNCQLVIYSTFVLLSTYPQVLFMVVISALNYFVQADESKLAKLGKISLIHIMYS